MVPCAVTLLLLGPPVRRSKEVKGAASMVDKLDVSMVMRPAVRSTELLEWLLIEAQVELTKELEEDKLIIFLLLLLLFP